MFRSVLSSYMKFYIIFIGVTIISIILSSGCVTINVPKENVVVATPTVVSNTPSTIPTTNEDSWIQVIDNTYILTGSGSGLNQIDIPIIPNSVYRLNLQGEKRLTVRINPNEKDLVDSQGKLIVYNAKSNVIAASVTNYNGIFKTDSYQKNLHIEWVYFSNEPNVVGTSQNVKVKLERYNGDPAIFPDTTNAPEPYRNYDSAVTIRPTTTQGLQPTRQYN
jgi:hypothetical protein